LVQHVGHVGLIGHIAAGGLGGGISRYRLKFFASVYNRTEVRRFPTREESKLGVCDGRSGCDASEPAVSGQEPER
jgi:hypothetical protein